MMSCRTVPDLNYLKALIRESVTHQKVEVLCRLIFSDSRRRDMRNKKIKIAQFHVFFNQHEQYTKISTNMRMLESVVLEIATEIHMKVIFYRISSKFTK